MLISGASQRIHSDQVLHGKFSEPGACSSREELLVKAAVTEVYFHISFASSLSKQPSYKHAVLLDQILSRSRSIWVTTP